jgi:threonine/homoserine/homoserine lactone efflux protein
VDYLVLGATMGLGAGLAPGPLLALVLLTGLRRGFAAGSRVAAAPLVSDAPVLLVSVLAVGTLPPVARRVLAVVGGGYVVWLGVDALHQVLRRGTSPDPGPDRPHRSVLQAALVNLLSPHPWLFWVTVGAPILVRAWDQGWLVGAGFLGGFYVLLVGSKVALAWAASTGRRFLGSHGLPIAQAAAGGLLVVTGAVLLVGVGIAG